MSKQSLSVKKAVANFRERYGLTPSEPLNLHALLLRLNVNTLFRPLSSDFSGMACKLGEYRFMLINSAQAIGRQNFTIGHELYHLFQQENFTPHRCNTGVFEKKSSEEYNADCFSANLLMPEDAIFELIPDVELSGDSIKLSTILKIEQIFGVSHKALLYRLFELGIITRNFLNENGADINRLASSYGFDTALYNPGNENVFIGDFGVDVNNLFDQEKVSESHYFELLSLIRNEK